MATDPEVSMENKRTLQSILTPKQFRVALLVSSGSKNSEIAVILRTTENVIKNILREVYDHSGCSNRVELALLLVHETEMGTYNKEKLHEAVDTLNALINDLDEELAVELVHEPQ
jgi:DNA-binding CsgD family transcriptional regulator